MTVVDEARAYLRGDIDRDLHDLVRRLIAAHNKGQQVGSNDSSGVKPARVDELKATDRALKLASEIPPGWKLVPLEPTDEMLTAGRYRPGSTLRLQYYRMLDEAPNCQSLGVTRRREEQMDMNEFIREDMQWFRKIAAVVDPQNIEEMADYRLLQHAERAMRDKLAMARYKGRGGWWNEADCTIGQLRALLREHVEKGDMRDVMNLAAMVYVREIADMTPNK